MKDIVVEFVKKKDDEPAPLIKGVDPVLEALLAEEDEIARRGTPVNVRPRTTISTRRQLLNHAADLVDGDRNAQYGDPIDDFRRTGIYWSTHIGGVLRRKLWELEYAGLDIDRDLILTIVDGLLDPHDVAIMMTQLKNSRLAWSPGKQDHWADSAGYAACGYDCVEREGYDL